MTTILITERTSGYDLLLQVSPKPVPQQIFNRLFFRTTTKGCSAAWETHRLELLLHQSLLWILYILMCKKVRCILLYEHLLSHPPKTKTKNPNTMTFWNWFQKTEIKRLQNKKNLTFTVLHCLKAEVNYINGLRGNFFFSFYKIDCQGK